jgi:three-Cys-motif partner protein
MSTRGDCRYCVSIEKKNGNCTDPAPGDGLPVQCVGQWATDKHHILKQYIEATWAVRAKYLPPRGKGGAAYIDLFAGPGKLRIRNTGEVQDGSPLIALRHTEAPFSRLIYCDLDPDNVRSLAARTAADADRTTIVHGDCNTEIERIAALIPRLGLNIALIDPYGLKALKFSTLRRLAEFPRMDFIIHFPTGDIKRNLGQSRSYRDWLNDAMGTSAWATRIASDTDIATMIAVFKEQLATLGYLSLQARSEPIKNDQNLPLYYLVYASKNERGDQIWQSITKNAPSGQRGFGF